MQLNHASTAAPPLLFALPGAEHLARGMRPHWRFEAGALALHRFPDGECCPRFGADLRGRDVVLAACLEQPDAKLLALYLAAATARELGAASIGLVLPYLPYMRQDKAFGPGEGTSARHLAALLTSCADWMATVDPHLHRIAQLDQVFGMPALAVSSAEALAQWIRAHVERPVVVGPDSESAQWVARVAGLLGCPHVVMEKVRTGDREVRVVLASGAIPAGYRPVLLDDIAASGHTLARAVGVLRQAGAPAPTCLVVHALFAADALAVLKQAEPAGLVSCNTIVHETNGIDICQPLAEAAALLALGARKREAA
jgi:ribose-phosphate pyrophosphokinase